MSAFAATATKIQESFVYSRKRVKLISSNIKDKIPTLNTKCAHKFFPLFWVLGFKTALHSISKYRCKLQTKHPTTKLTPKMPRTDKSTIKRLNSKPKW